MQAEADIIDIDMEQTRCSKNWVSCEHVFPSRCLQATDPSNGVSTSYLSSARASLNGMFSLPVTSPSAGIPESELVLVASSERRMSGVWNDGASMAVLLEMSGAVSGPRMEENAERRKEEQVECLGPERLEAVEDM